MKLQPMLTNSPQWVQACITNVSFPTTLADVQSMLTKHEDSLSDLEVLLALPHHNDGTHWWTAPRWLAEGDLLFFYHAIVAKQRIASLLKQTTSKKLIRFLERSAVLAERYAGTIFGYAEVAGPTEYLAHNQGELHFDSRHFAPLGQVHIFKNPLGADKFGIYIKISRQGTLTYFEKKAFDGLKAQLAEYNPLPPSLGQAEFNTDSFRYLNGNNWTSIACSKKAKFTLEVHLGAYFAEYLLEAIKDKRTPVLQECSCYRKNQETGIVDYFIQLEGQWVPVEIKLNILAESNLLEQLAKYTHIQAFRPTKGSHKGKIYKTTANPMCVVIDQAGVYLVVNGKFKGCNWDEPLWRRVQINPETLPNIREHLCKSLAKQ